MKKLLFIVAAILFIAIDTQAQKKPRVSPKDSIEVSLRKGVEVKIVYSRPSLKGRELQNIVPYGEVWRTGANEATTFEINKDVAIEGKRLRAGKYSLYTIPGEKESTVMFNKVWNQWGTKYAEEEDALKFTVSTKETKDKVEQFTIDVNKNSGLVTLEWGNMQIPFKIKP